ncbi:NupC/NupG family nucleoside CNT transporter [Magnetococcales bacterium HHB-1]
MLLQSILGITIFILLAWSMSEHRTQINWRLILSGLLLQCLLAALLIHLPPAQTFFSWINQAVLALQEAVKAGTSFVFGFIGGGALPYQEATPGGSFVLAFQALPLVLVVSALSSLLFYWRILPKIVQGFSWLLQKSLGVGGALGLGLAANIFVGMVEAPLLIRPYLLRISRGELFALMTAGMATIAGTVMVLYAMILSPIIPNAMGHILTASLLSAPAALIVATLMVPHQGETTQGQNVLVENQSHSAIDALTQGTTEGVKLLIQIIAMLTVFVACIALLNQILSLLPLLDNQPITLQRLLGWCLAPIAWLMGIPWSEATLGGSLLGIKVVLNELLAYIEMSKIPTEALSERSRIILTYALCGFANFGSLGIMLGGMGTMAPERRQEITTLGSRSIIAGLLATCMTGAMIAIWL